MFTVKSAKMQMNHEWVSWVKVRSSMNRRKFIRTGTTALAGIFCGGAVDGMDNTPKDGRPNILFIMTDQAHAGMMSCTGNKWVETPAMDSLAEKKSRNRPFVDLRS